MKGPQSRQISREWKKLQKRLVVHFEIPMSSLTPQTFTEKKDAVAAQTVASLQIFVHVIYTDYFIILLNFIFTGLHGYQITRDLGTNKQRHRLLLLKMGMHVAPIHL